MGPFLRFCLIGACLLLAIGTAAAKDAVPSADAQQAALKLVIQIYTNDMEAAQTPAAKVALARKLIITATETTDDAAGAYALLMLSRQFALDARNVECALEVAQYLGDR